jgi:hypothetical protein
VALTLLSAALPDEQDAWQLVAARAVAFLVQLMGVSEVEVKQYVQSMVALC